MSTTIEELAVLAKDDFSHIEQLWHHAGRLIGKWAYSYYNRSESNRHFDEDDLTQAGFLAVCDTVRQYSPERGAFNTILKFNVRNRFAEVGGHRGTKKRPELYAQSLDEPISDDTDITHADLLEDINANFEADLIEHEANKQKCSEILFEIDKLPQEQRQALMLTAWDGLSFDEAGERLAERPERVRQDRIKAITRLKGTRAVRLIQRDYYTRHVSINEFRQTGTSEVEKHIFWLEGLS